MNRELYEKIAVASINLPESDRLSHVLKKSGKLSIMFLGGSITAGYVTDRTLENAYPKLVYEFCTELFPNRRIEYKNLGMGSYTSEMGLITAVNEEGNFRPDVVFIEFAVNNGFDRYWADCYESLVRRVLSAEETAVVIINTCNKDNYTCEPYMSEVAQYYNIPTVSGTKIIKVLSENGIGWDGYSDDTVHPNEEGHRIIAQCIKRLFEEELARNTDIPPAIVSKPCFGNSIELLGCFDRRDFPLKSMGAFVENDVDGLFPFGWKNGGGKGEMTFHLNAHYLFVIYEISQDSHKRGKIVVSANGKEVSVIDGYSIYGWNNPTAKLIYLYEKENDISIKMLESDKNKDFFLYGFAVCV